MSNQVIYVLDEMPTDLIPNLIKSDFLKLGRPSAEVVLVHESDFDKANYDADADCFHVRAATLVEMERNFFNMQILGFTKITPYFDFTKQKVKADFKTSYRYDADDHDPEAPMLHLEYCICTDFQAGSKTLTFEQVGKAVSIYTEKYDDLTGEREYGDLMNVFAFEQFMEDIGWETDTDLILHNALKAYLQQWANENSQMLVDIATNTLSFDYEFHFGVPWKKAV